MHDQLAVSSSQSLTSATPLPINLAELNLHGDYEERLGVALHSPCMAKLLAPGRTAPRTRRARRDFAGGLLAP